MFTVSFLGFENLYAYLVLLIVRIGPRCVLGVINFFASWGTFRVIIIWSSSFTTQLTPYIFYFMFSSKYYLSCVHQ